MLTDTIHGISPAGMLRMSKSDQVIFVESSLRHHMTTSKLVHCIAAFSHPSRIHKLS